MHIEKNMCNIIYTLLNDRVKSKDHINARRDLKSIGIRLGLWPNENDKYPLVVYTLTSKGKKTFLTMLKILPCWMVDT